SINVGKKEGNVVLTNMGHKMFEGFVQDSDGSEGEDNGDEEEEEEDSDKEEEQPVKVSKKWGRSQVLQDDEELE
ncbi:hypothetical protein H0H87_010902, partial [Tephrocybe sp. NHM501043]